MSKRPTETRTSSAWMLRIFKNGKWECDMGEYFDRDDVENAIDNWKKKPGEEYVPVKITTDDDKAITFCSRSFHPEKTFSFFRWCDCL